MRILFHFRSDISHRLPFASASCLAETRGVTSPILFSRRPAIRLFPRCIPSHPVCAFPLFITLESLSTSLGCLSTKIDSEAFSTIQPRVFLNNISFITIPVFSLLFSAISNHDRIIDTNCVKWEDIHFHPFPLCASNENIIRLFLIFQIFYYCKFFQVLWKNSLLIYMYKIETQFPFSFHFSTTSRTHIFFAFWTYNILICILERITELDIITSVIAISFCALRIIAERGKKNGKWKRERDEKRKGERWER